MVYMFKCSKVGSHIALFSSRGATHLDRVFAEDERKGRRVTKAKNVTLKTLLLLYETRFMHASHND